MRKSVRKLTRSLLTIIHDRLFPDFAGLQTPFYEFKQDRRTDANSWLAMKISEGEPFCAARFGGDELEVTQQWRRKTSRNRISRIFDALAGGDPIFTFFRAQHRIQKRGLTPLDSSSHERFAQLMIDSMKEIDLLGSWIPGEAWFHEQMPHVETDRRQLLEPFWHDIPWTLALEGKRVLIVHPFDHSISEQYKRRSEIFPASPILPNFTLMTLRPPRAHFGEVQNAEHWFDLMGRLSEEVVEMDFDVALIGAGPFGLPLAAEVKKAGRQAIHLGGVLQIIFGIKGKRWQGTDVSNFFNDSWIYPSPEETPPLKARRISESSYW